MKKASEIYNGGEYWWDYTPMLEEFGDILLREDDEGWQGDSFLIYHNDNKYGYLSFGWGSCSGCDALQSCKTISEVQELMDSLYNEIEWYESIKELKESFDDTDWELKWEGHSSAFQRLAKKVMEL